MRVLRLLVFGLALMLALNKFGVEIMPLVMGLGVAGVGIGLAAQGVIGNVISGLTIVSTKPFRVGESSITLGIKPWVPVSDYTVAQLEIYRAIVEQFHARGIDIPFPQREVRMLNS